MDRYLSTYRGVPELISLTSKLSIAKKIVVCGFNREPK